MPKRARAGSSTANAAAADAPSLLDLPARWSTTMSLGELKSVALHANYESDWQSVGTEHRAALIDALSSTAAEWRAFVASVLPMQEALAKGQASLRSDSRRLGSKAADRDAALAGLQVVLPRAMAAAVHLVPSGSGVHLGGGLVLTCAHCIDHDDDGADEPQTVDFTGGSSRPPTRAERVKYEAAHAAWERRTGGAPHRVGRHKACVTAGGAHADAECVAADEARDLALLRLRAPPEALGLDALALAAEAADATGTPVLAVGRAAGKTAGGEDER